MVTLANFHRKFNWPSNKTCGDIPIVFTAAQWQGEAATLRIHYDDGFTLINNRDSGVIWQHPFSHLIKSSDDGLSKIWFVFNNGDQQREVVSNSSYKLVLKIPGSVSD